MGFRDWLEKIRKPNAPVSLPDLTGTQKMFLRWNAERLNLTPEESERRYIASWGAVKGGHAGIGFREFNVSAHELFRVFFNDSEAEIYDAYRFYGPLHMLRMLSYPEPVWSAKDLVVKKLLASPKADILDYGCGLAQRSRSLAGFLRENGIEVRLFLADIPTLRKDFLLWLGEKTGIPTTFLECTAAMPIPELPACDVCFALDFFEHVHNPVENFNRIHQALRPGGLLEADLEDHENEFMHVSPRLGVLRARIRELGYEEPISGVFRRTPP